MPFFIVSRRFGRPIYNQRNPIQQAIESAERHARGRTHPKMVIVAGDKRVTVPYAPRETQITGLGWTYTEVIRPGRKPLVQRSHLNNWKQSFDLYLGTQDVDASITPQWVPLLEIIEGTVPFTILNGPGTNKTWYITSASLNVLQRALQSNAITRAVLSVEMTQATELPPSPGPVAAAVAPAPPPPPPPPAAPAPRIHTVVKGDTLSLISKKYYGTISRWPELAKVNNIRNPNLIYPGQKFRIP